MASHLSSDGSLVYKDQKIVIPRCLQSRVLELAHEPHLGISSMKRRLRIKVWWSRMDDMIEQFVKSCHGCILVSEPDTHPITRSEMPKRPWEKIAIDFTEVTGGIHLLVATDYYSRFVEVAIMTSMTATITIKKLREMFARFGYPEEIICDNGQPFSSGNFLSFCKTNNINIKHSVPYAAFQNGLVERQNRTLLKTLKISASMGRNWEADLQDFLHSYRATPHSITNFSPAELMFGWNIRDKLPYTNREIDVDQARKNDEESKEKGRKYTDSRRKAKPSSIDIGDQVVVKNFVKKNKLTSTFHPDPHVVVRREGTRLILENLMNGVISNRHVNHAKCIRSKNPVSTNDETSIEPDNDSTAMDSSTPGSAVNPGGVSSTNVSVGDPADQTEEQPEPHPEPRSKRMKKMPLYLNDYDLNMLNSYD